jgi:hypothetical protein
MVPVSPQIPLESIIHLASQEIIRSPLLGRDLYLDPGSGSYLLQLLIAALVGSAFMLRTFWSRIKSFFMRNQQDETEELGNEE